MQFLQRLESLKERIAIIAEGNRITRWFDTKIANPGTAAIVKSDAFVALSPMLSTLLEQLKAEVSAMTVDNRITFMEFVNFIGRATRLLYGTVSQITSIDPVERKLLVLTAVDEFYTRVLAPLDIPYVPAFFENSYLDPLIGTWVHDAASAFYDIIVSSLAAGMQLQASNGLTETTIASAVLADTTLANSDISTAN